MVYCNECKEDVLVNKAIDSETDKPYYYCCVCQNEISLEVKE